MSMANNVVMEEKKDFMVSPTGSSSSSHSIFRAAHFLTPSLTSIDGDVAAPPPPPHCLTFSAGKSRVLRLHMNFRGRRYPPKNWESWVHQMHYLHHQTWKKAGILDAIMSSIYIIHIKDELIFWFSEKWCPVTNSFVFPWGEATVTLEDIMILGGYSVLGDSILSPVLEDSSEMEEIVKQLKIERINIIRTKARKASQGRWMSKFMGTGNEMEHQAFLAYWLSRFVFPIKTIGINVLSIAARLARGDKIALAPAVLARIYRSLSLLKSAVISARKIGSGKEINISAPLALVQVWVFERFPSLRPEPNPVRETEPRMARWHNLKKVRSEDILLAIDSAAAAESFEWRPYMKNSVGNVFTRKIYKDNEYWVVVDDTDLDDELEGLVRCLRVSELVGLEPDCIEQYLPHRVAMQFGMDQDIPCHVARVNENTDIAWSNYSRPFIDSKLYVPSRLCEPGVTTRYLKWWKEDLVGRELEEEEDDLTPISKLFRDGRNVNIVSREVGKRQRSPLSSASSGAAAGSCDKGGFKSSEMISIPVPGSAPKSKRNRTEENSGDSTTDLKPFQSKSKKFVAQRIVKSQESPLSSEAEKGSCGKGSSFKSSERSDSFMGPISPPPGFAPLHNSPVKVWDLGYGSYGNRESQDNAQGEIRVSPKQDNSNIQEVTSLVEPRQSEIKNKLTKEDHVQRSTSEELFEGLQQRLINLENLCSLLKEGKLNYILVKNPNQP